MQIEVAGKIGFCFGVKRAIKIAERTIRGSRDKKNIYSLGAIIHNPQVVEQLSKKGLEVIKDPKIIKSGTVIISSHGAPKRIIEELRVRNISIVDATCPFVKYAQEIVKGLKKKDYKIEIVGDKHHPEVKALLSLAGNRPKGKKIGIVSQTTQNKYNYLNQIQCILQKDFTEVRIFNTICNDTSQRQVLARDLLARCDVMIVIGGKNSANTKRLWQICKERGVDSYHIELDSELKRSFFKNKRRVGVVSGASTPNSMVEKVVDKIKNIK
ncbi:MAG: 4-hydroxy-3-methylbut-2-enyl diphosphate reductase [Candidatus Omnitrophota bacterium]